jgi:hypothetical protein
MTKPVGAVWQVIWSNPYTDPPGGEERVRAEMFVPYDSEFYNKCPQEIDEKKVLGKWCITWSAVMAPPRQLTEDALKSVRQKRLKRRMEKKYPLFADQLVDAEMKKKPDYYEGKTDPEIQNAKDQVIEAEKERFEKYMDQVIVERRKLKGES